MSFMRTSMRMTWLVCAVLSLSVAAPAGADDVISADPALRWWRGNLHTHTFWSDGNDFPEMVAEWYRTHGYHFLALSDHNVQSEGLRFLAVSEVSRRGGSTALEKYLARFGSDWVEFQGSASAPDAAVRLKPFSEYRALVEERGRFLMLPSEEISDKAEGVPVHLNAANIQEVIQPLGGTTVREAIANNVRAVEEQARRTGREMMVHLNHPNFGLAITAEDLAAVVSERFFEVYNGHPGVNHLGDADHPPVEALWDVANTIRVGELAAPPLFGIATDDSHTYHGAQGARPGRGWTMVRARHLTAESLIRAMKRGELYASSGVSLADVRYAEGVLELDVEPDGDAQFTTQFIGTLADYDRTATPRTDAQGKPIRATKKYSASIGAVLATAEGLNPKYELTGRELYVRAVVTSDRAAADPSFEGQKQQAWTQPVGWEKRISDPAQQ